MRVVDVDQEGGDFAVGGSGGERGRVRRGVGLDAGLGVDQRGGEGEHERGDSELGGDRAPEPPDLRGRSHH